MIHTAYVIHTGVVDLKKLRPSEGDPEGMEFGNKMAVLSGDFLLANASTALAQLYNIQVNTPEKKYNRNCVECSIVKRNSVSSATGILSRN